MCCITYHNLNDNIDISEFVVDYDNDPDMPGLVIPEDTHVQVNPAENENEDVFEIEEIPVNIDTNEIGHHLIQNFMSISLYSHRL